MDNSPTQLDYYHDMWNLQSTATLVSHFKVFFYFLLLLLLLLKFYFSIFNFEKMMKREMMGGMF